MTLTSTSTTMTPGDPGGLEIIVEGENKAQNQLSAPPDGAHHTPQTIAEWMNRSRTFPLVQSCMMSKDVMEESIDIVLNAAEKYPWDNKAIAQEIKKNLDDRLSPTWHVIVGEAFSFEVSFESSYLLYLFYGSLGILVWKCGTVLKNEMKYKKQRRV